MCRSIKGTGGEVGGQKNYFSHFNILKIWNTRVQELFTELKKLAGRFRMTSTKLGPKCVFCGVMPFLYGKFEGKNRFL